MFDVRGWLATDFLAWILVFTRVSGILIFAPVLGSRNIPMPLKAGFAFLVSLVAFPGVAHAIPWRPDWALYLGSIGFELMVGLAFGLATSMLFSSLQLAGQLVGQQMSIALANVIDPISETEVSIVGEYKFFLGISIYLLLGGHRAFLRSLDGTFQAIPLGGARPTPELVSSLSGLFGDLFALSLQFAFPAVAALFLATLALAFVARTVPQMNVFVIGFPLQVGMGLALLALLLPVTVAGIEEMVEGVTPLLSRMTAQMGGGGGG